MFSAGGAGARLVNKDNTMGGSGNLGGGNLAIVNGGKGVINAFNMIIDTGAAAFVNRGLVDGYLVVKSASVVNKGTIALNGGGQALIAAGPTLTLSGRGTVHMQAGAQITNWTGAETVVNSGNTIAGAGTIGGQYGLTFSNGGAGIINANDATAPLTIEPSVTLLATGTGPTTHFSNAGLAEATGGGDLRLYFLDNVVNTGVLRADGGTLDIYGSNVTNTGGKLDDNGTVTLTGASITGGSLTIRAGGLLNEGPSAADTISVAALSNAGTIIAYYATSITTPGAITNTGTIEANGFAAQLDVYAPIKGGVLLEDGAHFIAHASVTGGAAVALSNGGVFELAAASDASVSFGTFGGQLWLDDWHNFTGTLENFGNGSAVDFRNLTLQVGDTLSYTANAGGTGGTVAVMRAGAAIAQVNVVGSYSAGDFGIGYDSDGHIVVASTH